MNILMVSDVYFPRINGVSTSIDTFRRELLAKGHHVTLIAPDYYAPSDDESHILRVPARYLKLDPEDRMMKSDFVMKLLPQLREMKFDILHIQTPFVAHYLGVKLSKALNIPRVESYHTFFEEYLYHYIPFLPKSLMKGVARRFSRYQCNNLHGMIVPSRPMFEVLQQYGITTPAQIIPTGLEPYSFEEGNGDAFRDQYDIARDRPTMLFVGRVAFEKNIGFLLQVTERVRREIGNVLFIIAGEGPSLESLKTQASDMGLMPNMKFIGYLDRHRELASCYRAGNVFVFASRTETQGLVLLEAMAQGVPVVSIAEMGTKDVLLEGAGARIVPEDVPHFANTVVSLLRNMEAGRLLGEAGRDYARSWSASCLADRLVEFYAEVYTNYQSATVSSTAGSSTVATEASSA